MEGRELVLDADGDTTITADTDDQIDIKIAALMIFNLQQILLQHNQVVVLLFQKVDLLLEARQLHQQQQN